MELTPETGGALLLIIGTVIGFAKWAWTTLLDRIQLWIFASSERSRRRNRRESSAPHPLPRGYVPETFEDENTDMHELVELEREQRKKSPGERKPRRGTHHD